MLTQSICPFEFDALSIFKPSFPHAIAQVLPLLSQTAVDWNSCWIVLDDLLRSSEVAIDEDKRELLRSLAIGGTADSNNVSGKGVCGGVNGKGKCK